MGSSNTDIFEAYFRRADLDGDGQISGAEAVAFFKGFSLPKHVLAQVWRYADQRNAGYLGREGFYNALKLVTVAQSKRELTPEIVKAALYSPASSRIPAPTISLAATASHEIDNNIGSWLNKEASKEPDDKIRTSSQQASTSPHPDVGLSDQMRKQSKPHVKPINPAQDLLRKVGFVDVETLRRRAVNSIFHGAYAVSTPRSRSNAQGSCDEFEFSGSDSQNSALSSCSSSAANSSVLREDPESSPPPGALAKALESLYAEETIQRKEIEEASSKEKEVLEKLRNEKVGIMEELQNALNQKLSLERQLAEADETVKELEQKIISAVQLLQKYKKERNDIQLERDYALKEAEELRKSRAEASLSVHQPLFFSEFSLSEIEEATNNFDPSLMIGEGGYGSVYKGVLHHTPVAIKMLHSNSLQGPSEFQQEVVVLSKVRHPHVVTLIGACPEAWALVYEYLPTGSLEDRLSCKDSSPPLSWQTRVRIATELCSALIFLHSNKQHSIVHGDLKPDNILLDANLGSKLSDFGISRLLHRAGSSANNTTFLQTGPKGTFVYMDPEFLTSGELTSKSDVYSFGIILLRLLTGRSPLKMVRDVQCALEKGELQDVLDPLAGEWPFVLSKRLAHLALRCCEMSRKNRPDLASEVRRVLESMKASCGGSPFDSHGLDEPPSYFICPIFQEVMQDPQFAADGFTYEAEALRGWFDSGHDTSPMTNLKLEHCNLVPNRALRSAIQESLPQQNP